MQEDVELYKDMAIESMDGSIEHLQKELQKIRTGKATPSMLGGILVPYYGNPTPLNQMSTVSAADAKTLVIQPWEKTMLGVVEKAIFEANHGCLDAMGDQVKYIGEIGAGAIPKLICNSADHAVQTAIAEVFTAGVKTGVEPRALWDAICQGVRGRVRGIY